MPLMGKKTFQIFLLFLACTAVFSFTACREEPKLNEALARAGLGDLTKVNPTRLDPQVGAVVQAFNAMVERYLEDY